MKWFCKKKKLSKIDIEIEKAKSDPTIWVSGCGKPTVDENGSFIFYKSYWLITTNNKSPKISNIS